MCARARMRVWSSARLPSGRVPAPPSLQTGACVCTRASVIARGEVGLLLFFSSFFSKFNQLVVRPRGGGGVCGHEWVISL